MYVVEKEVDEYSSGRLIFQRAFDSTFHVLPHFMDWKLCFVTDCVGCTLVKGDMPSKIQGTSEVVDNLPEHQSSHDLWFKFDINVQQIISALRVNLGSEDIEAKLVDANVKNVIEI